MVGVAFSAQPVFGYNHGGANNHQRIEELLHFSLKFVVVIGVLAYAFIYLFAGGEIVILFNVVNPEEVELATQALRLFYIATAFMGRKLGLWGLLPVGRTSEDCNQLSAYSGRWVSNGFFDGVTNNIWFEGSMAGDTVG